MAQHQHWPVLASAAVGGILQVRVSVTRRRNPDRENGMLRWLGLGLLLGIGVAGDARAQGLAQFDGQYMGSLTLTNVINGDCTTPPFGSIYPLVISGGGVRFAYAPHFGTTLTGKIDKNGVFKASARLRHGSVQMTGRVVRLTVAAEIVSPSCKYSFQTME
jgi:hypothetical protein